MNGADLHDHMMRLVERIEREPRFSIAWTLAYGVVLPRVQFLPADQWPDAIEDATRVLLEEIRKTSSIAKHRRRTRALNALLKRVETRLQGGKLPDTRKRRRRKVV